MTTLFLFCSDPLNFRLADMDYLSEADAIRGLNGAYLLVDFKALTREQNIEKAVRRITHSSTSLPASSGDG